MILTKKAEIEIYNEKIIAYRKMGTANCAKLNLPRFMNLENLGSKYKSIKWS